MATETRGDYEATLEWYRTHYVHTQWYDAQAFESPDYREPDRRGRNGVNQWSVILQGARFPSRGLTTPDGSIAEVPGVYNSELFGAADDVAPLGVELNLTVERILRVDDVTPRGLIAQWNRLYPGYEVGPGDWIINVNGELTPQRMSATLQCRGIFDLLVLRIVAPLAEQQKHGGVNTEGI